MVPERITDPTKISRQEIGRMIAERGGAIVQFSDSPINTDLLAEVDWLCKKHGDALEVRFFGHYTGAFDAALLKLIPNVQNLSMDCLFRTASLDGLFALSKLTRLSLGIFELNDANVLAKIKLQQLKEFSIGETKSTKIDLSHLAQCSDLTRVWIEAQPKGMEAIQSSRKLTDITLRRIGKDHSVAFISNIPSLKRLMVILGGRPDIDEIAHPGLETLEIVWVRGLSSLGDLGRFPLLQDLRIEDQLQLKAVEMAKASPALRRLTVINCKKLATLGSLAGLGALEEVVIGGTAIDIEQLVQTLPRSVHTVRFWGEGRRRDKEIREKLNALGYKEYNRPARQNG